MRQGIGCVLCEAEPGSLAEVRRCLEAGGSSAAASTLEAGRGGAPLATICWSSSLRGEPLRGRSLRPWRRSGRPAAPTLALCAPDDARPCRSPPRCGFDDMLAMPFDPVELVRRLQTLADLSRADRGAPRRSRLFAAYRDGSASGAGPPPDASTAGPAVVLLGRPTTDQVQMAGGTAVGERDLSRERRKPAARLLRERRRSTS